jgi:hypothetical protein
MDSAAASPIPIADFAAAALQLPVDQKLRFGASWPHSDDPEHPHHVAAVSGWHCFGCRGVWDVQRIARDFHDRLIFSECRGVEDAPTSVTTLWKTVAFAPAEGVVAILRNLAMGTYVCLVWASTPDKAKREFVALRDHYKLRPKRQRHSANFAVITSTNGMLSARDIAVAPKLRSEDDLALHYGEEFIGWNSQLIQALKQRDSGVTILRGEPGTGKTSYLRFLTHALRRTHRFYFLPLCVYPLLSNPATINFWIGETDEHKKRKKVIILEDAESLLMQRATDNQESVSMLLNMSDGLLGDALRLHVICTLNCAIDAIDSALLRPGRLVAMRQFERIPAAQATLIAQRTGVMLNTQGDYSLAELYNSNPRLSPSRSRVTGFA